ncbi:GNAT family N-acetyltransferase [Geodermatophilus sabuli]|uniref:Acetyltransferase (GNAT) domain-containing protein n=1 Tax=Geodermatophilus sabuli TaxID=1564158 RepID=A0A285EI42_9ACTN|nr:hypothetical protein [Geodermatophilus sabuli]SNX98745.1 Acetyltransferase (GNAT) domain-containing protein [Geodermatophilus sabuli]
MTLWLVDGERACYHLGASSDAGRPVSAGYASFAAGLERLRDKGVRLVDFGGLAGGGHEDGLACTRSGRANDKRPAYLCGLVLGQPMHVALTSATRAPGEWSPACRAVNRNVTVLVHGAGER